MKKRVVVTRRVVMVSMAVIMLVGNTLACTVPGQGGNGSVSPQPIPIDQTDNNTVEQGSPALNGDGGGPGLSILLSDGQEVPTVFERLVPVKGSAVNGRRDRSYFGSTGALGGRSGTGSGFPPAGADPAPAINR